MKQQRSFSGRHVAGTVVVILVAMLCVRLGIWQLHRLEEKRARNRAVLERGALPPLRLHQLPADTGGVVFRRVSVTGTYDDAHTIVVAGRSLEGAPGVHLLTPLRVAGTAVLVNRGWVRSADASTVDLAALREPAPRELPGLLVHFPDVPPAGTDSSTAFRQVWHRITFAAVQRQFPYRIAPYVLQLLPAPGAPETPRRLPPPELDEGPHLGYAIQWFSFAVIGLIGWIVLLRKRT